MRELVLDRQIREAGFKPSWASQQGRNTATRLRMKLEEFFGGIPAELHHRPSLLNREQLAHWNGKDFTVTGYKPDANDPDYLVYLPIDEHDIETRVRGQHGDYSDLAKARKRKRREKKLANTERLDKAQFGKLVHKRPKRKWPSRPFPQRTK